MRSTGCPSNLFVCLLKRALIGRVLAACTVHIAGVPYISSFVRNSPPGEIYACGGGLLVAPIDEPHLFPVGYLSPVVPRSSCKKRFEIASSRVLSRPI